MERFEDCIYVPVCEIEQCTQGCMRYNEMNYMLKTSNIPKRLQGFNQLTPNECDLEAFMQLAEIKDNIEQFVQEGRQLYIYSDVCGNGKTTWSVKLMLQYFHEMWACNGLTERGIFINVTSFLHKCKAVITTPDPEFEKLRKLLYTVDLVVWDDMGIKQLSAYDYNEMYVILNERNLNGKCNIYTGNLSPSQLLSVLGDRLYSRMVDNCTFIEFLGGDNRGPITDIK